ncbi:MAG: hypothetical protein QXE24_03455 [Desulfurococcaceae archaeon]
MLLVVLGARNSRIGVGRIKKSMEVVKKNLATVVVLLLSLRKHRESL